jgi:PAS domain S-box-containing protein
MLADASGRVLAANRAWFSQCGLGGSATLVGTAASSVIAEESREHFANFVHGVSAGEATAGAYDVLLSDGSRRRAEIHAARLQREDDAPVVLIAMWDVTDHQRVATALADMRAQHEALTIEHAALHKALTTANEGLQIAEADFAVRMEAVTTELRRERVVALEEATSERVALEATLAKAHQEREASVREASQAAEALQAAADERDRREADFQNRLAQQDAAMAVLMEERDRLQHTVHELNGSYAELLRDKGNERRELDTALAAEHDRVLQLQQESDEWRSELAELLRLARATSDQAQALVDKRRMLRLVPSSSEQEPVDTLADADQSSANGTPGEGGSWLI